MKKGVLAFLGLLVLGTAVMVSYKPNEPVDDENNKQSPFVGSWGWIENSPEKHTFNIRIGERNDSLLFSIGGVFYGGLKIHSSPSDLDWNDIAIVKVPTTECKTIKSKISEMWSNFYFDPDRMNVYNDVSFELLNDTTMLFILPDNKGYWPDTAIMVRRDKINRKFSNKEEELLYKE